MAEQSDEQLLAQLKSDPDVVFRILYDRYAAMLLRFVFRFTADQQIAEDILHDIFSELLGGGFHKTERGNLKGWLFVVAKNKSLNSLRKANREVSMDMSDVEISEPSIEERTDHEAALAKLKIFEDKIPSDLRQTWALRKQGFGYQEIADHLAIPIGTVKSRFSRLVAFLKEEFEK